MHEGTRQDDGHHNTAASARQGGTPVAHRKEALQNEFRVVLSQRADAGLRDLFVLKRGDAGDADAAPRLLRRPTRRHMRTLLALKRVGGNREPAGN
jgi:hypothetical protein